MGGFVNGSYVLPIKYRRTWEESNVWLFYSLFTFLIIPVFLFLLPFGFFNYVDQIPLKVYLILMLSGFLFGISIFFFSIGLKHIGMGVSFLLNIAGGTVFGSLVPILILHSNYIFQPFGLLDILGLSVFVVGTVMSSRAAYIRDVPADLPEMIKREKKPLKGIFFSVLSGVIASVENIGYTYSIPHFKAINDPELSTFLKVNYPWAILFFGALFSTSFLFMRDIRQNLAWDNFKSYFRYNLGISFIMSVCAFGSLLIFGYSSLQLGDLGPVVAWPVFMIVIVLTSNFWSFRSKEWIDAPKVAFKYQYIAITLFLVAIVIMAIDGEVLIHIK